MRRLTFLAAGALFLAAPSRCANPDDIHFHIAFVRHSSAYHVGESIEIEISYATDTEKKYRGSWGTPLPEMSSVNPRITPAEGAMDLRDLIRGFAGSYLSSMGCLGIQPIAQKLYLGDWYRFRNGHYSLIVTSTAVSRIKGAEEGEGQSI